MTQAGMGTTLPAEEALLESQPPSLAEAKLAAEEKATVEPAAEQNVVTAEPEDERKATVEPSAKQKATVKPSAEHKATAEPAAEQKAAAEPAAEQKATVEPAATKPSAEAGLSAASGEEVQSTPAAKKQEELRDYEQFSGLRIINRCFSAAEVAAQMQGAKVLRFTRLQELRQRADCNRIVVGVMYETFTGKLGNGELYTRWCFTDLAEPEPRRLIVLLRGRAYEHWRKAPAFKTATRKSIFAIMNPRDPVLENNEWTVRVENPGQLAKLGDCPSCGLCDMKGCQLPVNNELKDRFCKMHLSLAYANKGGRILTGGNQLAHLLAIPKRKRIQARPEEEEEEELPSRVESAKRLKATVAMQLDERRFMASSRANHNYFRAIREGTKADRDETSRVPVLGRALDEGADLEIDMATIATDEKVKAERMIERIVEKRAEKMIIDDAVADSAPSLHLGIELGHTSTRASSSSGSRPVKAAKAPKKSLNDLMEALKGRRIARRAGVIDHKPATEYAQPNPHKQGAKAAAHMTSNPSELLSGDADDHQIKVKNLLLDLDKAGEDLIQIKAVLDSADTLPISVLEGAEGSQFYRRVGDLTMHAVRVDIRREALLARRRWRSASFDARQAAIAQERPLPSQSSVEPPALTSAETADNCAEGGVAAHSGAEVADAAMPGCEDGDTTKDISAESGVAAHSSAEVADAAMQGCEDGDTTKDICAESGVAAHSSAEVADKAMHRCEDGDISAEEPRQELPGLQSDAESRALCGA